MESISMLIYKRYIAKIKLWKDSNSQSQWGFSISLSDMAKSSRYRICKDRKMVHKTYTDYIFFLGKQ